MPDTDEQLETARSTLIKACVELRDHANDLNIYSERLNKVSAQAATASKRLTKTADTLDMANAQTAVIEQAAKALTDVSKITHAVACLVQRTTDRLKYKVIEIADNLLSRSNQLELIDDASHLGSVCDKLAVACDCIRTDATDKSKSGLLATARRAELDLDAADAVVTAHAARSHRLNAEECLKLISYTRESIFDESLPAALKTATEPATEACNMLHVLSNIACDIVCASCNEN